MADQETKIEPCPCCGAACREVYHTKEIECTRVKVGGYVGCSYMATNLTAHNALPRPKDVDQQQLGEIANKWAIDIDNIVMGCDEIGHTVYIASYLASKLSELKAPRDVAGLEEAGKELAAKMGLFEDETRDFCQNFVAAVRDFCDPEITRQRDLLVGTCKKVFEARNKAVELLRYQELQDEPDVTKYHAVMVEFNDHMKNLAFIADCEATK